MGHLPGRHIQVLLDKNLPLDSREWHAGAAAEHRWSSNVPMNKSLERAGAAPPNFARHLAAPESKLVQQMVRLRGTRLPAARRVEPLLSFVI
ncbi:MAG: hypothetical protein WCC45_02740 [Paeniglutamicibacter sp.]